jgi:hypothetical protein
MPFLHDVSTCSVGWRRKSSKGGTRGGIIVSAAPCHRTNAENVPGVSPVNLGINKGSVGEDQRAVGWRQLAGP